MEKRLKTHPSQWAAFLDFAEANPQILTKKFDGVNGRRKYNQLWEEIAETLNSMGYLKKTVDKWQKAVADWKSKVKSKAAGLNKGLTQTGGGGPLTELNENEKRLIAILGTSFISGIKNNEELGLIIEDKVPQQRPALLDKTMTKSFQISCNTVSPPPLSYIVSTDKNTELSLSITEDATLYEAETSLNKTDMPPLKQSVQEDKNKDIKSTPKKRSWEPTTRATSQKIPSTTSLTQMHEDTLKVLKHINDNIEKMANSQERLAQAIEQLIINNN